MGIFSASNAKIGAIGNTTGYTPGNPLSIQTPGKKSLWANQTWPNGQMKHPDVFTPDMGAGASNIGVDVIRLNSSLTINGNNYIIYALDIHGFPNSGGTFEDRDLQNASTGNYQACVFMSNRFTAPDGNNYKYYNVICDLQASKDGANYFPNLNVPNATVNGYLGMLMTSMGATQYSSWTPTTPAPNGLFQASGNTISMSSDTTLLFNGSASSPGYITIASGNSSYPNMKIAPFLAINAATIGSSTFSRLLITYLHWNCFGSPNSI